MNRSPVLDWLLERRDPGVRALTLRDLLDAAPDDPEVVAARRATARRAPVREILAAQDRAGYWVRPGPGYGPKYTGTVWQVIFLGQFGADGGSRGVQRGVDYVLDHSRSQRGGFSINAAPGGMVHCLQGNLGSALIELGALDDPRLQQALDWLARSITGEGLAPNTDTKAAVRYLKSANSAPGFVCSANNQRPCAWGAVPALEALARVPARRRTPAMRRAIEAGVAFLFSRDPAAADYPIGWGTKPNASWFKFGYPLGYVTDVLRTADVLVRLGHGRDPRLVRLRDLILEKRRPDGRWNLEYSYAGKTWFDLGPKRRESKWVTLRCLRVLKGMGVSA